MIKLRSFLKLVGLSSLIPTIGLASKLDSTGKIMERSVILPDPEFEPRLQINWCITRNILIPCQESDGSFTYDTNKMGNYVAIVGDILWINTKNINLSRRASFESEPMLLSEMTDKYINDFLDKVDKEAKARLKDFSVITGYPVRLKIS